MEFLELVSVLLLVETGKSHFHPHPHLAQLDLKTVD